MTDLANPSPPPGDHPSLPAGKGPDTDDARMRASAHARIRAGARQDNGDPVKVTEATPAVPEPPGIEWVSLAGTAFIVALCAGVTWTGGYEFAQQCAWPAALAWILPLISDIYAATALWIMLGLHWASRETRHFAAGSTVLAVAESVAIQVMYHILLNSPDHKPAVGVVIAVSVVAPIMLALTVHLAARVNSDRGELVRVARQAQARHAEAQQAAVAKAAEDERAAAARVAADQAAAARAAAEGDAAAKQAEADRAATERADAERAAAAQRAAVAQAAAARAAVAHRPDTTDGPSVAHGPSGQMAHEPPGVAHAADGPDDDPGGERPPGVLAPEDQPDEPEMPGDKFAKARNVYRQSCRDGKAIADRPLGAQFGHSRNWGGTRIKEVNQGVHLAAASGQ